MGYTKDWTKYRDSERISFFSSYNIIILPHTMIGIAIHVCAVVGSGGGCIIIGTINCRSCLNYQVLETDVYSEG